MLHAGKRWAGRMFWWWLVFLVGWGFFGFVMGLGFFLFCFGVEGGFFPVFWPFLLFLFFYISYKNLGMFLSVVSQAESFNS